VHNSITHRKIQCMYCTDVKVFMSVSGLDYHAKTHHQTELIQCKYDNRCALYFKTEEEKQEHIVAVHHQRDRKNCVYCAKAIPLKSLSRHVKKLHKNEAIKCNFHQTCERFFLSTDERDKHIFEDHKNGSTAKICIYCKKKVFELHKHVRLHHESEAIRCDFAKTCAAYFHSEQDRQNHVARVHGRKSNNFVKCIYCDKMVTNLFQHVHIYHKSQAIKCNFNGHCATYFHSQKDRKKHVAQVHGENSIKCIYCEKMLKKDQLQHMKNCHKDVAIKCDFLKSCPNYFRTEEERDEHVLKVHQTAKPTEEIKCLYCEKVFHIRNSYFKHVRLKHRQVMVKCDLFKCSTFFHTREEKEKHFQETHAKAEDFKIHKCNFCSFKSISTNNVKLHVAKKHGTKNVKCSSCFKIFKSKLSLSVHFKALHTKMKCFKRCIYCKKQEISYQMRRHLISDFCKICNKSIPCSGIRFQHKKYCK